MLRFSGRHHGHLGKDSRLLGNSLGLGKGTHVVTLEQLESALKVCWTDGWLSYLAAGPKARNYVVVE